jgi:hypothetical protein
MMVLHADDGRSRAPKNGLTTKCMVHELQEFCSGLTVDAARRKWSRVRVEQWAEHQKCLRQGGSADPLA